MCTRWPVGDASYWPATSISAADVAPGQAARGWKKNAAHRSHATRAVVARDGRRPDDQPEVDTQDDAQDQPRAEPGRSACVPHDCGAPAHGPGVLVAGEPQ